MSDSKSVYDSDEIPEDLTTLYSWANLHGAKYRDFASARAQVREKAFERVQGEREAERPRARDEGESQQVATATGPTGNDGDEGRAAPANPRSRAIWTEQPGGEESSREAPRSGVQWLPRPTQHASAFAPAQPGPYSEQARESSPYADAADSYGTTSPYQAPSPHAQAASAPPRRYVEAPQAPADGTSAVPPSPYLRQNAPAPPYSGNTPSHASGAPVSHIGLAPREQNTARNQSTWTHVAEVREAPQRPAWLSERPDATSPALPQAPPDSLQGSRDRLTSRWFALKGIFSSASGSAASEPAPAFGPDRAPALALFSLAGGVGKTSLVATLGRALSARGERVLLIDTASFGLLPFFFGARDQRPGALRTFTPPNASGDAPIQMLSLDPETLGHETSAQEPLSAEILRHSRGASRILVDLATASGATTRRILHLAPTVLVPVIPDLSSVVSVSAIDAFFAHSPSATGQAIVPFYLLNQFDPSLPLHLDVREVLREQLNDRLLPFALRRAPAVSEALAEGMTVMDYAPDSAVAEDFSALASWVASLVAPAAPSFRGIRWSER